MDAPARTPRGVPLKLPSFIVSLEWQALAGQGTMDEVLTIAVRREAKA